MVTADQLGDALWGRSCRRRGEGVQGCIVRLRKVLGATAIETCRRDTGCSCRRTHGRQRFERLLGAGSGAADAGEPDRAAYLLGEALALWRGPRAGRAGGLGRRTGRGQRLDELRLDAEELRLEAALRRGRHREVLGPPGRVEEAALRERRWAMLALAQYQAGRRPRRCARCARSRTVLSAELGLDPGPDLVALEDAILRRTRTWPR